MNLTCKVLTKDRPWRGAGAHNLDIGTWDQLVVYYFCRCANAKSPG